MAAMIVHTQKNVPEAKKRYNQILKANPRAAVAANNLAWIYAEEGQELDLALKLAQSAAEQFPDRPEVQDTLGWVYYRKELPSLAIRPFEHSIENDPDNPMYHYHLALAYAKSGDVQQARRAVEKALTLKPDFADARRLLASLKS
jgi:tetratricopeptide (TPR) repeat protein